MPSYLKFNQNALSQPQECEVCKIEVQRECFMCSLCKVYVCKACGVEVAEYKYNKVLTELTHSYF